MKEMTVPLGKQKNQSKIDFGPNLAYSQRNGRRKIMSIARIRMQLEKWKLSGEDELSIGVTPIGPYLLFGDSTGDYILIAFEADVSRCFNQISFRLGTLSREAF